MGHLEQRCLLANMRKMISLSSLTFTNDESEVMRLYYFRAKPLGMDKSEIKLSIFREVDLLDESQLEELYTFLHNFLSRGKSLDDWLNLSREQQNGLKQAIDSIEAGESMVNEEVLNKYRKRYSKD